MRGRGGCGGGANTGVTPNKKSAYCKVKHEASTGNPGGAGEQSDPGLLAWDVDRLIDLTVHLQRVEVPGDSIRELYEPFWFAGGSGKPPAAR